MRHDTTTVVRVRRLLSGRSDVVEKGMIGGGRAFVVGGHLCCAVKSEGLVVRLGAEGRAAARGESHVRPLLIGGRETAAFVVVEPAGYHSDEMLRSWVERGLRFVATLT